MVLSRSSPCDAACTRPADTPTQAAKPTKAANNEIPIVLLMFMLLSGRQIAVDTYPVRSIYWTAEWTKGTAAAFLQAHC